MAKEKIEEICQIEAEIADNSWLLARFSTKNPSGKGFHVNLHGCRQVSGMIRSQSW